MEKQSPKGSRNTVQVLLWTVMIAVMVLLFVHFMQDNRQRILQQNANYVADSARQRASEIDRVLREASEQIGMLSYYLSDYLTAPVVTPEDLRRLEEHSSFDYVRFVNADGLNISSDGRENDATDREYYQEGMAGKGGTSVTLNSRITNETLVNFYTPVYYEGQIIGVLRGVFLAQVRMQQLLDSTFFGEEATTYLCLQDGTIIAGCGPDLHYGYENGVRKLLLSESGLEPKMVEQVTSAFREGRSTSFTFFDGRNTGNGFITRLNTNNWYLLQTFPAQVTGSFFRESIHTGVVLVFSLVGLFVLYIAFVLFTSYRQRRRLMAENQDMDYILRGMPMLFTQFILIDLERNTYRYLRGSKPSLPDIAPSGQYALLRERIVQDVAAPADRARMREFLSREQMRKLQFEDSSIEHQSLQDGIWARLNVVCVQKHDGIPVKILLAKQNITEVRRKEIQRQETLQKAMHDAEKANIAKSTFLFNMSHDLRTPMNAIIGFTTLAQRHLNDSAAMQEYLEKIQNSSQILLGIINDVLDLARIESGKTTLHPEPGDLRSTAEALREMFEESMETSGITFRMEMAVSNPLVVFDSLRLSQILINLLSNARKFTHPGGSVACRIQQEGTQENSAQFCMTVSDTGIGISPEFLPNIFGAFERERTSTVAGIQGTGLGLSIVKELVEMMNGTVTVESTVGKGSTFILHLAFPIAEPQALIPSNAAKKATPGSAGKRLLLVEDNELNREIALEILTEAGYQVETANDGNVAVDMVSQSKPGYYNLILMDIQMPTMDGYRATRLIRALPDPALANIPIAAMTANAFDEDKQRAREAGMNAHVAKPLNIQQLMETITALLAAK